MSLDRTERIFCSSSPWPTINSLAFGATSRDLRKCGRQQVHTLDERQPSHVADHQIPIGPAQFGADRGRSRIEQLRIETKRQLDGIVPQ